MISQNIRNGGDTEGAVRYDTPQELTEEQKIQARDNIGVSDASEKEDKSNKVTFISAQSTDTQYPSAKCVYDIIGDVETLLAAL